MRRVQLPQGSDRQLAQRLPEAAAVALEAVGRRSPAAASATTDRSSLPVPVRSAAASTTPGAREVAASNLRREARLAAEVDMTSSDYRPAGATA